VRQRERRRKRHQPRAGQWGDVAAVQRLRQLRTPVGTGSAIEGVRVEEARERALLQAVGGLDDRPEDVLPAEHPVGEEVEPRGLLDGHELSEVALDLHVDGLLARAPSIEVARRLDELLRTRIDAWCKCLQVLLLYGKRSRLKRSGALRPGLFRRFW
jgi:hypothetical protein